MTTSELTNENFLLYAAKHYENPRCESYDEFLDDLNRIKYVKRLIRKYLTDGVLRERLLLNHILVFYNVFGSRAATDMLFFKIDSEYHSVLKTFLIYLNFVSDDTVVQGKHISDVPLDTTAIEILRSLGNW